MQYQLTDLKPLNSTIYQLKLSPCVASLNFLAGQYVEIEFPDGSLQPFSIANAPKPSGELEFHIRSHDRATHDFIHGFKPQQKLELNGAFGQAYFRENCPKTIIILAAGTGFAYAKSIIEAARDKHVILYWGVKNVADFYDQNLLKTWQTVRSTQLISRLDTHWPGKTGYVYQALIEDFSDLSDKIIYASGPFDMIQQAFKVCLAHDLEKDFFISDMI